MYRLAGLLADEWAGRDARGAGGRFAQRARATISGCRCGSPGRVLDRGQLRGCDLLLAALTGGAVAGEVVGYTLIASGGGALGVRLGMPVHEAGNIVDRPRWAWGRGGRRSRLKHGEPALAGSVRVCFLLFLLAVCGLGGPVTRLISTGGGLWQIVKSWF